MQMPELVSMKSRGYFLLMICVILVMARSVGATESSAASEQFARPETYQLVVVGATPSGIACAVRAARQGLTVLLVDRTGHVGGFMSSGCGGWEATYDGLRSPLYAEIRAASEDYYRNKFGENSRQHLASVPARAGNRHTDRAKVEPRVIEQLFEEMLRREARITLLSGYIPVTVDRVDDKLRSIEFVGFESPKMARRKVHADVFVDATYEGDLAALTKVPYRVGREARSEYGERHAGVVNCKAATRPPGQTGFSADAADGRLKLRTFPLCKEQVTAESSGAADGHVMAYNYRLILTKDPQNRVLLSKPANYDAENYHGKLDQWRTGSIVRNLPNNKIAWNAGRIIGPQNSYPDGDWTVRKRVSEQYLSGILGLLWYLQNDPSVPEETKRRWKGYGLARDEFVDNQNLPYEVYVREARRIVGRHVFTEQDGIVAEGLGRTPIQWDSIAITDWPIDSVACTIDKNGEEEGDFFLSEQSRPSQIPYRCLLPTGLSNLLVPVCLSASHVGWGAVRLEPVWMQTGEAAGFAAALAIRTAVTPAELDVDLLLTTLASHGNVISMFNDVDPMASKPWVVAIQYLGTKGFFATYDAHPGEPLTRETAKHWIDSMVRLVVALQAGSAASFDSHQTALVTARVDKLNSQTYLTGKQFLKMVQQDAGSALPIPDELVDLFAFSDSEYVTRGDACRLLCYLIDASKDRLETNSIPCVDYSVFDQRQVVVAGGTKDIYQGQPTTLLLPDGKTLFCVWTIRHGGQCGPLKRSDDGGQTWSDLIDVPASWHKVRNCPTIFRLADPQGKSRLFVFAGKGADGTMHQSISEDEGETWGEMKSNKLKAVMPFCAVEPVDGGKRLLAMTNIRRPGDSKELTSKIKELMSNIIVRSYSDDGGLTWSNLETVLDLPELKVCEPFLVRSPSQKQLLCFIRENEKRESLFMTSDDEGNSWSKPRPLPVGLFGDRHIAKYADDGRLVVCFRDTGPQSTTRDHFVAWVGRYEDILAGRKGEYRLKLLHSFDGSDCGYPGLEKLPDGTFVATTYIKYRPGAEKQSIVSVRFRLEETDALAAKGKS